MNQHLIRKHKLVYEEWITRLAKVEDVNKKVSKEDKERITYLPFIMKAVVECIIVIILHR